MNSHHQRVAPMLSVGPLQGFAEYLSSTQSPGLQIVSDHHHDRPPSMDDLTELFTLPTWPEVNPMSKFPWDHHNGTSMSLIGHAHYPSHDMPQLNQQQALCDSLAGSMHSSSTSLSSDVNGGSLISQGLQEAATLDALRRLQGSCQTPGFGKSLSLASSSPCDITSSINPLQSSTPSLPTWPQAYMGRTVSSPTLGLRQAKVEPLMVQDGSQNPTRLCGKRNQVDNVRLKAQAAPNEGMFVPICGPQAQQHRTSSGQQGPHGVSTATPYSSHTGLGQPQGAAAVVAGTARPRVRARRGQATDPHSIAERLRRERIADRMKALQELVPNANKTDKASMLDEIIEYVRFLQLQVKILSMSRLSGTSAVVPFVADIPSEGLFDFRGGGANGCASQDNMVATERQVARLMEESMGSALQFLQSKGLFLMPMSLASAMSSSNTRPLRGSSHGKTEASSVSIMTSSNVIMPMTSLHSTGDLVSDEVSSAMQSSRESLTQSPMAAPFRSGLNPDRHN